MHASGHLCVLSTRFSLEKDLELNVQGAKRNVRDVSRRELLLFRHFHDLQDREHRSHETVRRRLLDEASTASGWGAGSETAHRVKLQTPSERS